MYFGDYKKILGNRDWSGNLLEHLSLKHQFFVLERGMSNMLEMLLDGKKGYHKVTPL